MDQIIFISSIATLVLISIWWGFKTLPKERWQIMAVLPRGRTPQGEWKGLNLTYYGLLSANAYTFAVIMFFILSASVKIHISGLCVFILAILLVCIPASRIIAGIVEKKTGTLTVGGAVFTGTLLVPWLVWLVNLTLGRQSGFTMDVTIILSAICVSYAYGEGLGRLACISFGCCYGKPLYQCSPILQTLFSNFYLVFFGKTKKIAYASGFEGKKVIPIQIITAVLYSAGALLGTGLFLNGYFAAALLESLLVTQVWRFVSEFFRADFRGAFKITPYQLMSAGSVIYSTAIVFLFPAKNLTPCLKAGLTALWNPWIVLLIEIIWIAAFFHTGRSVVTGARIIFHIKENKI